MSDVERAGVGDEYPDERTMDDQPGLSGGEYPGAADQLDVMSENLTPPGQETTFGGTVGDYGPAGTMGTIEDGFAADARPAPDDTRFGPGPDRQ